MEKIIVFGKGKVFRWKAPEIAKQYDIVAFIDNSIEKEYDDEFACPVLNPDCAGNRTEKILVASLDFVSMWKQLKQMNVDDDRIMFASSIEPHYRGLEEVAFSDSKYLQCRNERLWYVTRNHQYEIDTTESFKKALRDQCILENDCINIIRKLPVKPISRSFGSERGKAVDRYYIEKFLDKNKSDIKGTCMEVGGDDYTIRFGQNRVERCIISHILGGRGMKKVNFETGEGVEDNIIDCIICTQTLQYIFDVKKALENIVRMLRKGGTALITVPGIKGLCLPDAEAWGEKWSFTKTSVEEMIRGIKEEMNIGAFKVESHGNAKISAAYLYGICCEELCETDFEYNDSQYPFLITVRIKRKE